MSIERIYREIPVDQRICEGCGEPIHRNLAVLDGKLYHYGCMRKTGAKPVALCLDCWSYLTGKNITKANIDGVTTKFCGECGSSNLKYLRRKRYNPNVRRDILSSVQEKEVSLNG